MTTFKLKKLLIVMLSAIILMLSSLPVIAEEANSESPQADHTSKVLSPQAADAAGTEGAKSVAASLKAGETAENYFLLQEDFVIQGVTSRQDYYFELSPSRKVTSGSYIEIFFNHSPTIIYERSTVTLLLDDVPLGSKFLDETNQQNGSWKINIGNMDFKQGFHKFSIVIRMESSDNVCVDQNNPANWMTLKKESVIHLRLQQRYADADLSWYPSPFAEKGSIEEFKTIFVMPDQPSEQEWLALGKLSQFFAEFNAGKLNNYKVYKESDLSRKVDTLKNRNTIWIGTQKSWNSEGKQVWDQLAQSNDGKSLERGVIQLVPSIWNEQYRMMLITGDEKGMSQAVEQLTNRKLYEQLIGKQVYVPELTEVTAETLDEAEAAKNSGTVSLASLDYEDLVIEGQMVGSARITYLVPSEMDVTQGGLFKMHFSHTKTLKFAQSLTMIKVNNIPISSTFLDEESTEFGVLEAKIPESALKSRFLVVDISFQFDSSNEACSGNTYIGNWAIIDNDSFFSFSLRPNRDLALSNLPYPFVSKGAWNPTVFVVPEAPTTEELSLFAVVNGIYGANTKSYDRLQIVKSPAASSDKASASGAAKDAISKASMEKFSDQHMIWLGLSQMLPEWLMNDSSIPITFRNGQWYSNNPNIQLVESSTEQSGLIQLFPSPLNSEKDMMIISGHKTADLLRLSEMLTDSAEREKITGQVLVLDSLKRVHTFQSGQYKPAKSVWDDWTQLAITSNMPILQRLLIVFGIVLVLAVFTFIIWRTRKRRGGPDNS